MAVATASTVLTHPDLVNRPEHYQVWSLVNHAITFYLLSLSLKQAKRQLMDGVVISFSGPGRGGRQSFLKGKNVFPKGPLVPHLLGQAKIFEATLQCLIIGCLY